MSTNLRFIMISTFLLLSIYLKAQVGTEFWFAAPDVISGHGDYPVIIRVTALEDADVTLSLPADPSFTAQTLSLAAGAQGRFEFNDEASVAELENAPANSVNNKGILITSTADVTVYYDVTNGSNPDRFTLKADNALGNEFYIPSQYDMGNVQQGNYNNDPPYEQVNIVATEDTTIVTIVPTVDVEGHNANVPYTVTLSRGQSYCIKGTSRDVDYTLSGTHIQSTKAIAVTISDDSVYSGPENSTSGAAWDLIGDQIIPVSVCGLEYIAMFSGKENVPNDENDLSKGWYKQSTEKVYVLATEDNTTVLADFSDTVTGTYELDAGESVSLDIENLSSIHITANSPIYVYQVSGLYKSSSIYNEIGSAILPPVQCTGSSSVTFTRVLDGSFFLQVLSQYENIGDFDFSDTTVFNPNNIDNWTIVPNTGNANVADTWYFLNKKIEITTGQQYTLSNDKGLFHLSIFDENNASASFGYFSAFNSLAISGIVDKCEGEVVTLRATEGYSTYKWYSDISKGNGTISTDSVLTVTEPGKYWVTATRVEQGSDNCILADTVEVDFEAPYFSLGADQEICSNSTYVITPDFEDDIDSTDVSYYWSDGSSNTTYTVDPSNETITNDTITVILTALNSDGCSTSDTAYFVVLPEVDIEWNIDLSSSSLCYGSTISNTTDLENYEWRYGSSSSSTIIDTTNSITVYNSGWYFLTATNDYGCTDTDSINITVNALPEITLIDDTICHNGIYTSPTNSDDYNYSWKTKLSEVTSTTSTISVSQTDSLYVIITDKTTGCVNYDTAYIYFRSETEVADVKATTCAYVDYTLTASDSIIGSYSWSYGGADLGVSSKTLTLNNILASQAGTYTVTGVDQYGCDVSQNFIITINTGAAISLGDDQSICQGDSVALQISSDVAVNYTIWYKDENPEMTQTGSIVADYAQYYVKESGTYYIKAETSNGCSSIDSVDVTVNALPDIQLDEVAAQCQSTSYDYNAGSGYDSYEWQDGSTGQTYTATQPQQVSVTVIDENGCVNADTTQYTWKDVNVLSEDTIVVCPETSYTISTAENLSDISWYFNDGNTTIDLNNSTEQYSISSVTVDDAGTYIVNAVEGGCDVYDTTYLYVVDAGSINLGDDRTICQGEVIQLNANEGFTSYEWYLVGELDIQSTESYVNAGTDLGTTENWSVIAYYNYGECILESAVTVDKLSLPDITLEDYMKPCSGDTVYLTELITNQATNSNLNTGDIADTLTYYWNGSSEALGVSDIFISKSGSYSLEVANNHLTSVGDTLHCYASAETEADYSSLFTVPSLSDKLICPGETTTLTAPDEVLNYSTLADYKWVRVDDTGLAVDSSNVSSDWEDINTAGTYVLRVQYADSLCFSSDTMLLAIKDLPEVTIDGDNTICSGDTTILSTTLGYNSYLWSTGATETSIEASEAGDYTLTVVGLNSCENSASTTLSLYELPIVSLSSNLIGLCNNSSAEISVSSVEYSDGTDVLNPSYEWSTWDTTSSINVSAEGEYSVTATDDNGCSTDASATVNMYPETTIDLSAIDTKGCTNEGILLECPFSLSDITSYQWTKSGGSEQTPGVNTDWTIYESGTYILTVVDGNLCETSDSVKIKIYTSPSLDLGDDVSICISSMYEISSSETYGSYLWSTGETTPSISIEVSGENDYWLQISDNHGCTDVDTIKVTTKQLPTVTLSQPEAVCAGVEVELVPEISGTTDYSVLWSTYSTDETITESGGTYYVTVTDNESGCSASDTVTINTYEVPVVSLGDDQYICPLVDDLTLAPLEGDIYSGYLWHSGALTYQIIGDIGQINSVVVTDENGCTSVDQVVLQYLSYTDTTFSFAMCQQDTTISLLEIDEDAENFTGDFYWYHDGSTTDYQTFSTSDTFRVDIGITLDGESTCYYKQDTIVMEFYPLPVITALDTIIYQTVTVEMDNVSAPYEYSMDSTIWQDDNVFDNLDGSGEYTVYVIDSNSCSTSKSFTLSDDIEINVPNFVTPNNDGYNDTWEIDGIERLPESIIRIYDRYGKLMRIYKATEEGWDGTYQNQPMPVTDYWYVVELKPINKLLKGHFTLKR